MIEDEETDDIEKIIAERRAANNRFDYSIDVDDEKIKRFKAYSSIHTDLIYVRDWINLLSEFAKTTGGKNDQRNLLIERSIFISSIITYGRCFAGSDGRKIKLESKDCFKYKLDKHKQIHKYIIDLRNQYIAHAGVSAGEKSFSTVNFKVVDSKQADLVLSFETFGQFGLSLTEVHLFKEVVDYLITFSKAKYIKASSDYKTQLSAQEKNDLLRRAFELKNAR